MLNVGQVNMVYVGVKEGRKKDGSPSATLNLLDPISQDVYMLYVGDEEVVNMIKDAKLTIGCQCVIGFGMTSFKGEANLKVSSITKQK